MGCIAPGFKGLDDLSGAASLIFPRISPYAANATYLLKTSSRLRYADIARPIKTIVVSIDVPP